MKYEHVELTTIQRKALRSAIYDTDPDAAGEFVFPAWVRVTTVAALMKAGVIEVASSWDVNTSDLKFYNWGREYRSSHKTVRCIRYRLK